MPDRPTCEVIVVGAGPAGSSAAAALARRGRDVLLVDRADFPRGKPCGDGIPPGAVGILDRLGAGEALRAAGFAPVSAIRLVSARGRDFRLGFRPRRESEAFFIAPRLRLDDLLYRHALASGAGFQRARVLGPLRQDGRVVGVRADVGGVAQELGARFVVAADGATSAVARALVAEKAPEHHRGVAIRAYVEGIETLPETVEFHFAAALAPGYAWIFPTGRRSANVGVIVRTDRYKRRGASLTALLDDFLRCADVRPRLSPGATVRETASWQVPYATPATPRRAYPGALLVGDAGRFVDPLTGEGIHSAVVTGMIAAEVIDDALLRGDATATALDAFDSRCDAELGALTRRSYRAQKYLVTHPWLLECSFIAARSGRGLVSAWLNRVSTDFRVG